MLSAHSHVRCLQRQKAAGAASAGLRAVILTIAREHHGQDDFEEAI